jgi:hypothetical protein
VPGIVKPKNVASADIDVVRRPENVSLMVPWGKTKTDGYFRIDMQDEEAQKLAERIFATLGWTKVEQPVEGEPT